MSETSGPLRRTPLYERHVDAGARIVPFAGFEMPVRYTSEKAEHLAVRTRVGMFDVSHMGEVFIEGPNALAAVQKLFSNDLSQAADGQAMYTGMLNARGTFIDDAIVYRYHVEKFLVCTNAGNRAKDTAHIETVVRENFAEGVTVRDEGDAWAQLAVQGPKAVDVVAALCGESVRTIGGYHFRPTVPGFQIQGTDGPVDGIVARTGYTGEDGFELYVGVDDAGAVWDAVVAAGAEYELTLCGLACRDTLRLEAGMALYGNDIDDEHTPLEALLGWTVKLDKGVEFIGADALRAQKASGIPRRLRGLEMVDRGIPRTGYPILDAAGATLGVVTSGTQAPFLNRPIAMAYVQADASAPGTEVHVEIRGKATLARVVKLPFYKRQDGAGAD